MTASADPRYCPLCGQPNRCAMELARSTGLPPAPCWCMTQAIAPGTLARIPPQALDTGNAARLWRESERLTGATFQLAERSLQHET